MWLHYSWSSQPSDEEREPGSAPGSLCGRGLEEGPIILPTFHWPASSWVGVQKQRFLKPVRSLVSRLSLVPLSLLETYPGPAWAHLFLVKKKSLVKVSQQELMHGLTLTLGAGLTTYFAAL